MSELFTELTDQQQELVAGGLSLINNSDTRFFQDFRAAEAIGASASGPGGSVAGGSVAAIRDLVRTDGNNDIRVTI